ncbi:spore germination protein [Paenibacillus sp. RRE4]|uniref:spore germination protein n=1 Tax=Paenibacillus sp. RRE4 TaxID=2962587 RepID=UPI0028812C5A|nr:spore germination protein [Paenibacillus sp. RRE4]MDT0121997.1 spore germination protein [Paenibacillus sp. RRE4]
MVDVLDYRTMSFSTELSVNVDIVKTIYNHSTDIKTRTFPLAGSKEAFMLFIDGMVNESLLDLHVLAPLLQARADNTKIDYAYICSIVSTSQLTVATCFEDLLNHIANGCVALLVDQLPFGIAIGIAGWQQRGIEEPAAESIIRGPREGFTETLSVNTSMLRRKIKDPSLKLDPFQVGRYTKTSVLVAHIDGIANHALVEEVHSRIRRIDIDGVLESGYIEGLIEDHPYSPFPQIQVTERPDVVSASLLEGKIGIMVDGTPFCLIAPTTFFAMLQSPEDYYQRYIISSFIRWLRFLFLIISLVLPSLYVAILTFHQEMVPTSLLLSIAKSREEIPFPALIEALLMEVSFEALREAGVRLPKQVGSAVSIVGALVIGQAATSAGLVSSPMVMVVAITGIASFLLPQYSAGIAIRLLRFPIMFLSGMFGLLGLMLGVIAIIIHLCSLRSLGVPYLQPLAPMKWSEMLDSFMVSPIWANLKRPSLTGRKNAIRQPSNNRPDQEDEGASP